MRKKDRIELNDCIRNYQWMLNETSALDYKFNELKKDVYDTLDKICLHITEKIKNFEFTISWRCRNLHNRIDTLHDYINKVFEKTEQLEKRINELPKEKKIETIDTDKTDETAATYRHCDIASVYYDDAGTFSKVETPLYLKGKIYKLKVNLELKND